VTTILYSRALHALGVVATSVAVTFVAMRLVPGDPLSVMLEHSGRSVASSAALRERLGLDSSIGTQFIQYVGQLARGDMGASFGNGQPVAALIRGALTYSAMLAIAAVAVSVAVGVTVGSIEGWWPQSRSARAAGQSLTALYAIPEFVLALTLIALVAYRTGWFPIGGAGDPALAFTGSALSQFLDRVWHLILPTLTLALGWSAAIARQQRRAMHEVASEPFVRTARAKGVSSSLVFWHHGVRPSLPSVVATVGLMLPALISGAVVVELIFSWPGLGSLMMQAIANRDYPVVNGAMIVVGSTVAAGTLLSDLALWWLDPRTRGLHD
jgi:peptide/nickel transport system permease protein